MNNKGLYSYSVAYEDENEFFFTVIIALLSITKECIKYITFVLIRKIYNLSLDKN